VGVVLLAPFIVPSGMVVVEAIVDSSRIMMMIMMKRRNRTTVLAISSCTVAIVADHTIHAEAILRRSAVETLGNGSLHDLFGYHDAQFPEPPERDVEDHRIV